MWRSKGHLCCVARRAVRDVLTCTRALPPAKYLAPFCHQLWPSEDLLPQIVNVPILFLSGLRDEIVPYVSFDTNLSFLLSYGQVIAYE